MIIRSLFVSATLLATAKSVFALNILRNNDKPCRFGDKCWPSNDAWNQLNSTVNGRLVRARPSAAPCHGPEYNEQACQIAQENFNNVTWRGLNPGAVLDLAWENGYTDCWIDDPRYNISCPQALVPIYVVEAETVADIQHAVKFAKKHTLSTTVKGTGHDYLGRSFGEGTFNIATIRLRGVEFGSEFRPAGAPDDSDPLQVVHVAAGERWGDVYGAAEQVNRTVVGGAAITVGAVGGWVTGGGHSALSPQYGLGVDNVVQFEIVTPDGELRSATAYENPDLFWALRGGGPGFGVITRVSYISHEPVHLSTSIFIQANHTEESRPGFIKTWLELQPVLSERNFSGYTYPLPNTFISAMFVYNSYDPEAFNTTLQPFWDFVAAEQQAGRPIQATVQFNPFRKLSDLAFGGPEPPQDGGSVSLLGSRLFPKDFFENSDGVEGLTEFLSTVPFQPIFHLIAGGKVSEVAIDATAIHPSWRRAIQHIIIAGGWNKEVPPEQRPLAAQFLTNQTQILGEFVPDFGAYLNESDKNEPDWQNVWWGSNYERLLRIKRVIDPRNLFTCIRCIGYEE